MLCYLLFGCLLNCLRNLRVFIGLVLTMYRNVKNAAVWISCIVTLNEAVEAAT